MDIDTSAAKPSPALQRWLFAGVLLWAVGGETTEGIATAGMVLTVIMVVVSVRSRITARNVVAVLREWWPLAAFVAWALIMPVLAGHRPDGVGVARLGDWLALPAAAVVFGAMDSRQRRALAWTIGGVFAVSCVAAGLQYRGWWPSSEAFRAWHWTRIPFDNVYQTIPSMPGRFPGGGLTFHRLKFSETGGLVVVAAVAYGECRRGPERWAAWATAALGLASIAVFAWSRAAAVAVLVALIVMALVSRLRISRIVAAAAVGAIIVGATVAASPLLRERFELIGDSGSNGDRAQLWSAGWRAVKSSPIAGVGLGQFRPGRFADAKMPEFMRHHPGKAHDQYLSFAAEIGIPGAVLFIVLLAWLATRMRGPGAPAGLGMLTFFGALSLVHDPLFHAASSMGVVLALGAAVKWSRERRCAAAPTSAHMPLPESVRELTA